MNEKEVKKKEKEIVELQNTINELNSKLRESESLKSNFISNIMNEVYNPFSSILSMADNIISLKDNKLNKAKPMAEMIYREASQLDFQLQNIFSAATIEAGLEVIELSSTNIGNILDSVIKQFQYDIINKDISINTSINKNNTITIISDSRKVSLILQNLLSNSIKYSPEKGKINIHAELLEGFLNIVITDDGPGISDSDLAIIYNRFKRIDETINSVTGGTGLGLSVVKALTEILEGNISFSNDNGTKVLLNIPNLENRHDQDGYEDDDILF